MRLISLFITLFSCLLCLEQAYADSASPPQPLPVVPTSNATSTAVIMHLASDYNSYFNPANSHCSPQGHFLKVDAYGPLWPTQYQTSNPGNIPFSGWIYAYYCAEKFSASDPTYQAFNNYPWVSVNGSYTTIPGQTTNVTITPSPSSPPIYCGPTEYCSLLIQKPPIFSLNLAIPSTLLTGQQGYSGYSGGFTILPIQGAYGAWGVFVNRSSGSPLNSLSGTFIVATPVQRFSISVNSFQTYRSTVPVIWVDPSWPPVQAWNTYSSSTSSSAWQGSLPLGTLGMSLFIFPVTDNNGNWGSAFFCDSLTGIPVSPALFGKTCSMPCNGQPLYIKTAATTTAVPTHSPGGDYWFTFTPYISGNAFGSYNMGSNYNPGYYQLYSEITCQ